MHIAKHYTDFTRWIGAETGATDTLLHIHAGMAVLLLARLLSGRSLATPVPLLCVCAAAVANEALDYFGHGRLMPDTLGDIVNTLVWPILLFLGLRLQRGRRRRAVA